MIDPKVLMQKIKVLNDVLVNAPTLIADVEAAIANEKNPVGESQALVQLLKDIQPILADINAAMPAESVSAETSTEKLPETKTESAS